jgi:Predicted transcriptional regulator
MLIYVTDSFLSMAEESVLTFRSVSDIYCRMSDTQNTSNSTMIDEVQQAKEYRRQLGLSQVDFANRFGLPLQTYVQWERGRRQPEISAKVLLSLIVHSPDEVVRIVRRSKRREMAAAA